MYEYIYWLVNGLAIIILPILVAAGTGKDNKDNEKIRKDDIGLFILGVVSYFYVMVVLSGIANFVCYMVNQELPGWINLWRLGVSVVVALISLAVEDKEKLFFISPIVFIIGGLVGEIIGIFIFIFH